MSNLITEPLNRQNHGNGCQKIIELSVSQSSFKHKPIESDITSLRFERQSLCLNEFERKIKEGYCFCHCFNYKYPFDASMKTYANFESTNIAFFDIDKQDISMKEFVDKVSMKPTLSYTTPSNDPENNVYCFRLCYVFKENITTPYQYKALCKSIVSILKCDVPQIDFDSHAFSVAQYMNGNGNGSCETITSGNIYSLDSFKLDLEDVPEKAKKQTAAKDYSQFITDWEFMQDFKSQSPLLLRDKYKIKYPFFDKSPLIQREGYYEYPENYTEIKRRKRIDSFAKSDKELIMFSRLKLIRDGERRRNKLYTGCLIRRQINPDVTFEHLLMNLVVERLYYFDNSDKVLTNQVLMDIAYNAISMPLEEINIPLYRPHDFCIDKTYCSENGVSVRGQCGKVRRDNTDEKIGEYYDFNLSVRKNLAVLNAMGIKVSKTRLLQFKQRYQP